MQVEKAIKVFSNGENHFKGATKNTEGIVKKVRLQTTAENVAEAVQT